MAVKKSELYSLLWEACNKLRGGVEPARYKDYVLVLLFFKYVSDRYKGQKFAEFTISKGASFEDLIEAKGKSDVGERADKIIQKFLEDNQLIGSLPDVSFNNADELGSGKELVDKVSGLIGVFQNPAIDFKNNRASGDDIIGDAYEYFMMKFAQESGKSKGQFYTPSEVSRIIARLIGIADIKESPNKKWTLYDPAAGSGSLLIRAADEAPVNANGDSIVTIFGQESDRATAGLAKMNLILHQKGTGEIQRGNTLSSPKFIDEFGELKKFDFIVMNPPFSDKDWSDGIKTTEDEYKRFDGYGIPPEKNGDYAWFLHVLKSLDSNGKCIDEVHKVYHLALASSEIESAIGEDINILAEKDNEIIKLFSAWKNSVKNILLGITQTTIPKDLIREISMSLLQKYEEAKLLDNYDVYDCLLNYWNAKLQDDVYTIKVAGYDVARELEYEYGQKKKKDENGKIVKDENGDAVMEDDTTKVKSFEGALIPKEIIESEFFADKLSHLNSLIEQSATIEGELDEMIEEESGEEGLLKEVLNDKGDGIPKANLNKRLKELDDKKSSPIVDALTSLVSLFADGNTAKMEKIISEMPELEIYELRNKNGKFGKAKLQSAVKVASQEAKVPELFIDEYNALIKYHTKLAEKEAIDKEIKTARAKLDDLIVAKYAVLTDEEIKYLLFEKKWMAKLNQDVSDEVEQVLNNLSSRVLLIARRYEHTLSEIEEKTSKSRAAVMSALERMGYKW